MSEPPPTPLPDLGAVGALFALPGRLVAAERLGSGHINETYLATRDEGGTARRVVHQRLNPAIFPDPAAVLANLDRVLGHLRAKLVARGTADLDRRLLRLVPAADGGLFARDAAGGAWRTYDFIPGAVFYDVLPSPLFAERAACAFGRFARDLADLPPPRLAETTPGFHHTPSYFARFAAVVAADPLQRAAGARREIDQVLAHRELAGRLEALRVAGTLPERSVHNDTKLNNVLFDAATGEALAIVDLDTVMPGLAVLDFGDMVRSAGSGLAEDEPRFDRVAVQLPVFAALARGYLAGWGGELTASERGAMVLASQVICLECGIRFLTDHLAGDTYFRIHRPGHNLDRSRTQLALLASLEARAAELEAVIAGLG